VEFPGSTDVARRLECSRSICACHQTAVRGVGVTHCPGGHTDDHPSLSISQRGDMVLWNCHAGCDKYEVRDALIREGIWPRVS
jgi:hypothetical protein